MAENVKEKIAETFLAMTARKSFDKITIKDLVQECGISRQAFYYHFQDILDVIEWIMQRSADELLARSLQAENPKAALRLFIDFAMWINPSFKYDVIKFVYDEMIKFRNLAGDAYPSMCRAVRSIMPEPIFREKVKDLARSLNIIVYGRHESEMRNKIGDESKIREMYELEKQIAQWINIGLVGNYKQLKVALNKLYYQKYPNALPI